MGKEVLGELKISSLITPCTWAILLNLSTVAPNCREMF